MQETLLAFSACIEYADGLQHLVLVYSNYSKHCAALTIQRIKWNLWKLTNVLPVQPDF